MLRICVFCGSNPGFSQQYREVTHSLGQFLAKNKIGLVYGGGKVGLMGTIADSVLEAGGQVTGIIPRLLERKEVAHPSLTEMIVVETMHDRKRIMYEMSDMFIALPGGLGTLDELCEILTWGQLGLHSKPCGLLNVNQFFDGILIQLDHAAKEGFLKPEHRQLLCDATTIEDLFIEMSNLKIAPTPKWLELQQV